MKQPRSQAFQLQVGKFGDKASFKPSVKYSLCTQVPSLALDSMIQSLPVDQQTSTTVRNIDREIVLSVSPPNPDRSNCGHSIPDTAQPHWSMIHPSQHSNYLICSLWWHVTMVVSLSGI